MNGNSMANAMSRLPAQRKAADAKFAGSATRLTPEGSPQNWLVIRA